MTKTMTRMILLLMVALACSSVVTFQAQSKRVQDPCDLEDHIIGQWSFVLDTKENALIKFYRDDKTHLQGEYSTVYPQLTDSLYGPLINPALGNKSFSFEIANWGVFTAASCNKDCFCRITLQDKRENRFNLAVSGYLSKIQTKPSLVQGKWRLIIDANDSGLIFIRSKDNQFEGEYTPRSMPSSQKRLGGLFAAFDRIDFNIEGLGSFNLNGSNGKEYAGVLYKPPKLSNVSMKRVD